MLQTLGKVLQPAPLLTILATDALLAAAVKTAPFGLALGAMLLSWLARYSIAVLESLASGERDIPVLSVEMILGSMRGWRSFLVMLAMVGLAISCGAAAVWLGTTGAIVIAMLAALVLPVALLTLGWTGDSAAALSPRAWLHFGRALGRGFFWLEAIGAVVIVAAATLSSGTVHLNLILRIAVMLVGWLLLVALAGTIIHARRDELAAVTQFYRGIDPEPSPQEAARRRQEAADEIYARWRNGARADAWDSIVRWAAAARSVADEYRWLYQQALMWDAPVLAARIAQELIQLDLPAGRTGHALRLARERLGLDPTFRPRAAGDTLALALLAGFEQHTDDPELRRSATSLLAQLRAKGAGSGARPGSVP